MQLLHSGVDISVIAIWLGHENVETTQIYLHADPALKENAPARIAPPATPPGSYHPPDALLAFKNGAAYDADPDKWDAAESVPGSW